MYICLCNNFNDRAVRDVLSAQGDKPTVERVYNACSGGRPVNCGSCLPTLRKMISEHNKGAPPAQSQP